MHFQRQVGQLELLQGVALEKYRESHCSLFPLAHLFQS